jgi:hypothetical protein
MRLGFDMKPGYNHWMIICLAAVLTLGLFVVAMAQDQNPPEGKDKGVWVLVEKKPEIEADKDWDNGAYYNNYVSFSGTTVQGGFPGKMVMIQMIVEGKYRELLAGTSCLAS